MEKPLELKLGKAELFGLMKMLKRFHTNWINENGTSFTNISTDQKLAKLLEVKWLYGLIPKLVKRVNMDNRRPKKILSHNGAR